MNKEYYECPHCGSDRFIRMYNVWNEEFTVDKTPTASQDDGQADTPQVVTYEM